MLAVAAGTVAVVLLVWTSTLFPFVTSMLTGLVAFAFSVQPVEAQYDDEEDECCSSHRQVIEADFEYVLVHLHLDGFRTFDGAAIAGPHYHVWIAWWKLVS